MKKKCKTIAVIQSLATDLLFWIYIFGCMYYLMHKWSGFTAKLFYVGIAAIVATIIFQLILIFRKAEKKCAQICVGLSYPSITGRHFCGRREYCTCGLL